MGFYDCMAAVVSAIGRRISMSEFDALYTRLLEEKDGLFAKGYPSDWLTAAGTVAKQIEIEKAIAQRQVIRSRLVYAEGKSFIAAARRTVDAGRALEARLVSINTPIEGGRMSVAGESHGLWLTSAGALLADLRRAGGNGDRLVKLFSTPSFEIEVARALRGEEAHPDARLIAAAIEKTREDLRRQENDAGGWRGKLDGYVTRQSHDSLKVRRAGYERWKQFILPLLDQERTFDRQEELLAQLRTERGQVLQQRLAAGREMMELQKSLDVTARLEGKATDRGKRYDKELAGLRTDFAHLVGRYMGAAEESRERVWLRTEIERARARMHTLATKASDARRTLPGLVEHWNETIALVDRAHTGIGLLDDLGQRMKGYEKRLSGAVDADAFLQKIYNSIAADTWMRGAGQEFKGLLDQIGPTNMARRRATHRELHFQSADAEIAYQRRFGAGGVADSVLREIEGAASAIATYRGLSTNPEAMFQRWRTELLQEARETGDHKLATVVSRKSLDWQLAEVLGTTRGVANPKIAGVAATIRTVQGMAKLGGAMLSSFGDIATSAAELKYQGRGALDSYGEMLSGMFKGRRSGERRIVADLLGVGFENLSGHILSRLGGESAPPGAIARAAALFFRLNGLTWWTDAHKTTAGLVISRFFAQMAETPHEQLPAPTQRLLKQFGLDAADWNVMRSAELHAAEDGTRFLTPEGLKAIDTEKLMTPKELQAIETLKAAQDEKGMQAALDQLPSERELRERRDRLVGAYATLITDRVDHAVVTPGARERAMVNMGTERGDVLGEALRFVMQFKSFGIAMVTRSIGRDIYGGGAGGLSATTRIAFLAFQLGIFGYLAMSAKEMISGKNPRDPSSPATWAAALAQGGGMGILGDYAFGQFNRFGQSALETAAGPTAGTASDLLGLWAKAKDTDAMGRKTYGSDLAASSLRTVISNTPFTSLWWLRPALSYLALYPVQEALNPGYLRRMEHNIQQQNHQSFWLSPQEAPRL